MELRKKIGLFLGPSLFLVVYLLPVLPANPKAHSLLAIFLFIVVWWVTECIPIPVTALLVPVLISTFQVASPSEAFAPFANPIIMLFLGSFILARAMSVHALDQKFAYSILSLKSIGFRKSRILLAFGLVTAFLSMWISNTATTAMMYPIALGVLSAADKNKNGESNRTSAFSASLLLLIAYSSSVGGIGTPIGSPPNLIAIGMLERLAGSKITFFQWMTVSFLALIPMFLALFLYMKSRLGRQERHHHRDVTFKAALSLTEKTRIKGLTRAQKNVLAAFSICVLLWISPGLSALVLGRNSGLALWLEKVFPEAVVAIIGASLLFLLPVSLKRGHFTLSLREGLKIDWGTLLLFGGGLSLGFQMFDTGLADTIGRFFISLGGSRASLPVICFLSISLSVYLTEVTSNTAASNMIIPIIIAISQSARINPLPPVLGSAIACSFAFMLPVATPPNAIVYGSGLVRLSQMMKCGFWLNIFGIVIIWGAVTFLAPLLGLI